LPIAPAARRGASTKMGIARDVGIVVIGGKYYQGRTFEK